MQGRNNKLKKKLDRYIGCPLVYVLGLFHTKRKLNLQNTKNLRIILLKTAGIGDTILVDAAVHEVKTAYPGCDITLVCSKSNLAMVKVLTDVDHIYNFNMSRTLESLAELRNLGHFDLLLDFAPWARINAVMSCAIHADFKVGFKRKGMYRHYIYDVAVEHSDDLHEMDNYRNLLKAVGIQSKYFIPHFDFNPKPLYEGKYVVFHLYPAGSSVFLRSWAHENWVELGKDIYKRYGYKILLSGGKEDVSDAKKVVDLLVGNDVEAENIAGKYNLQDMKNILGHAQFVVSVNTGIMHMAAAVGVPLIALHGATSVKRWGPLSDQAHNIWAHEKCQPCISLGFESNCKNPICMQHITVDMVMQQIEHLPEIA